MKNRKIAGIAAVFAVAGALAGAPGVNAAPVVESAEAGPQSGYVQFVPAGNLVCGASTVGWARYYRHCTSDGRSVEVLARFILAKNTIACVGPGQAVKVAVGTTYGLNWNGRVCTRPGHQWPESP